MPARRLSEMPTGSEAFLDANIMIYGLLGVSAECQKLLDRCSREEIAGVCLLEILNEASHKLMLAEAKSKGFIRSESAAELRRHFDVIPRLKDYWRDTQRMLELNLLLLPLTDAILRDAYDERSAGALLINDSMIVACMRRYGISFLATSDRDFERVAGIAVYRPSDL